MTESAAERDAVAAFEGVFKEGDKIVLDHYLNYYARTSVRLCRVPRVAYALIDFEYGRLLACKGEKAHAREHLELVMSGAFRRHLLSCLYAECPAGKSLEGPGVHRKGKYSMEVRHILFSLQLTDLPPKNALHVRTHAALEALDRTDRL